MKANCFYFHTVLSLLIYNIPFPQSEHSFICQREILHLHLLLWDLPLTMWLNSRWSMWSRLSRNVFILNVFYIHINLNGNEQRAENFYVLALESTPLLTAKLLIFRINLKKQQDADLSDIRFLSLTWSKHSALPAQWLLRAAPQPLLIHSWSLSVVF